MAMRLLCLCCGYDVSGLLGRPCPECGAPMDPAFEAAVRARAALAGAADAEWRRLAAWALGAVGVCGVGVLALSRELDTACVTMVGLLVGIIGSAAGGAGAARLAREDERRVRIALWVRLLCYLHGPWLAIPACTVLAAALGAASAFAGGEAAPAIVLVCVVGLPFWLVGVFACLVQWAARWNSAHAELGLRAGLASVLAVLMALATLVGAAIVGFLGGLFGGVSLIESLHPGWPL